ncbi:MAG TPA: hypothetical protein VFP72_05695 [Kineosporiaceae bacterium]|nr:hypothetical protein [Kineosporiaceae bacterium]
MQLTRLLKSGESGEHGCPAVYTTDDPDTVVIQGVMLDEATHAGLEQVAVGESAVAVPVEMLLRAAAVLPQVTAPTS